MHDVMTVIGWIASGLMSLAFLIFAFGFIGEWLDKLKNYRKATQLEALLRSRDAKIERLEAELAAAKALQEEPTPYRGPASSPPTLTLVKDDGQEAS